MTAWDNWNVTIANIEAPDEDDQTTAKTQADIEDWGSKEAATEHRNSTNI